MKLKLNEFRDDLTELIKDGYRMFLFLLSIDQCWIKDL